MSSKISVEALYDYDKVSYSKEHDIHMDVVLTAPEREEEKRIPLHLILAIDCSGSMSGVKMQSVKKTVTTLLNHLTENDTLGMVGFSDNVWEILPALPMNDSNRSQAKTAVTSLQTKSMTNISEALKWSIERSVVADKDKTCRIVFLTDGLPTTGVMDHDGLIQIASNLNPRVSLSTFGYGTDYDPELLLSMSKSGCGNHFYIEKQDDCPKAFAMELGGLLSLFGQKLKVTLVPTGNITIEELMSSYKCESSEGYRGLNKGRRSFTIDDIYVGEKKHAILRLKVPVASEAVCARPTKVCSITVEYTDVQNQEQVKVESKALIQYVKPGKESKESNQVVRNQLALIQAAKIQKEAKNKADAGQFQEACDILTGAVETFGGMPWFDGQQHVIQTFQDLSHVYTDRHTYYNVGSKTGTSYLNAFCSNRVSNSTSIGAQSYSHTTCLQERMLNAFAHDPTDNFLLYDSNSVKTVQSINQVGENTINMSSKSSEEKDSDDTEGQVV